MPSANPTSPKTSSPVLILHGEQVVQSRQALVTALQTARQAGRRVTSLTAAALQPPELEQLLGTSELFEPERTMVIEGLHSLPTGQRRTQLLMLTAAAALATSTNPQLQLILWEKRTLTATMLKPFGMARVQAFPVSSAVFAWLDSLSPQPATLTRQLKLLDQALAQEDAMFGLVMLARQVRLLLTSLSGGVVAGPPFVKGKIAKQAQAFSLPELLALHEHVVRFDEQFKLGQTRQTPEQLLEWLVVQTSRKGLI